MPVQSGKSGLFGRLGKAGREAFARHKNDETEFSNFGELPEGIEHGIAQLVECKFDQYKKGDLAGKDYFYAAGVVKFPREVKGFPVEGLRTSIMEPLCDTPNRSRATVDEHLDWVLNELRKLGLDTSQLEDEDQLEDMVAQLKEAAPHFRFRTWKGEPTQQYPNPRVNHQWNGMCEEPDLEAEPAVEDDTATAAPPPPAPPPPRAPAGKAPPAGNGKAPATPVTPARKPAAAPAKPSAKAPARPAAKAPAPAPVPEFNEFAEGQGDDLSAMAEAADGGDEASIDRLRELALGCGLAEETIDGAEDYAGVAALIARVQDANAAIEESAAGEGTDFTPVVGNVYMVSGLKDPRTKKVLAKPVEVEVTAVDAGKRTADVRNLDSNATAKGVRWDQFVQE